MQKGNNNGMRGKTTAKQGRHQDNDVARIKGKGKNKGVTTAKTIITKITTVTIDFIVNIESTEQLSCHDISNFEDNLN